MSLKIMAWPAFKNKNENPYNWLLYSNMKNEEITIDDFSIRDALTKKYDIFHVHWPDAVLNNSKNVIEAKIKASIIFFVIRLMKARGTKIVWTAHNLKTHDKNFAQFEEKYWNNFLKQVDGTINLTETGYKEMLKIFPFSSKVKHAIVSHGHYKNVYEKTISKEAAKKQLGIPENAQVLTFIGQIREYKNVPKLVKIFQEVQQSDVYLVIAGKPKTESLLNSIVNASQSNNKVKLFLKFIPDEEMQVYINSSDLVVLPYQDILNSGSALLSLSFERPILVPNKGALKELKKDIGEDWIITYEDDFTSEELTQALNKVKNQSDKKIDLSPLDWDHLAKKTSDFYKELIQKK